MLGPLRLGSTASLTELYMLVATFEGIQKWIEGAFCDGVKRWFMFEKIKPWYEDAQDSERT